MLPPVVSDSGSPRWRRVECQSQVMDKRQGLTGQGGVGVALFLAWSCKAFKCGQINAKKSSAGRAPACGLGPKPASPA